MVELIDKADVISVLYQRGMHSHCSRFKHQYFSNLAPARPVFHGSSRRPAYEGLGLFHCGNRDCECGSEHVYKIS
jgi:hypothetical protein